MPSQYSTIELQVHPELLDARRFQSLMELLSDYKPILRSIGEAVTDELAANFSTRGFGGWAPLAASTLREKRRHGDMIDLVRTGDLYNAVAVPNAPGHKMLIGPSGILIGIYDDVIPYAKYLDAGTRRMPARALIQVRPETKDALIQLVREWLVGATGDPSAVTVTMGSPAQA